jgi:hypothetical protein
MRIHRGHAATVLGIALSAVFLWLALRDVDVIALRASLVATRWWVAVPFLVSLFAFYWIKTLRWAALLRAVAPVTAHGLFRVVMVGYAAGALLPMQLGEVVRAWLGARRLGIRVAASFMSIALERVLDLLSILLLVAAAAPWMGGELVALKRLALPLGGFALMTLAVLLLFVFRTEGCLRTAERLARALPERLARALVDQIRAGIAGLRALRDPRLLSAALLASLAQWAFMFACVWLSLFALDIEAGPAAALLALILTVVGTSLPNSPGYVGSIQLAFTLALAPFGTGPSQAVAASLFFHVLAYLSVVLVGLALLPSAGLRLRELASLGERATTP